MLEEAPRAERRRILKDEARRRASGDWGPWERVTFPEGTAGRRGWAREFKTAIRNKVFAVLQRDAGGGVTHLAITCLSDVRPTWPEAQRIKDELAGAEATAVEVYPPHDEIVDDAPMYHLWVLAAPLPFTLFNRQRVEASADAAA